MRQRRRRRLFFGGSENVSYRPELILTRRESCIESGLRAADAQSVEGTHNACRLSLGLEALPQLGTFRRPVLELVKQFIFFLLTQRRAAAFLSMLVNETREVSLQPFYVGLQQQLKPAK